MLRTYDTHLFLVYPRYSRLKYTGSFRYPTTTYPSQWHPTYSSACAPSFARRTGFSVGSASKDQSTEKNTGTLQFPASTNMSPAKDGTLSAETVATTTRKSLFLSSTAASSINTFSRTKSLNDAAGSPSLLKMETSPRSFYSSVSTTDTPMLPGGIRRETLSLALTNVGTLSRRARQCKRSSSPQAQMFPGSASFRTNSIDPQNLRCEIRPSLLQA